MSVSVNQAATRRHALAFYEALAEKAAFDDEVGCLVFDGSLIGVFRSLGISNAYYTVVSTVLTMGDEPCITKVRLGARGFTSLVALHHPPSLEQTADLTAGPESARLSVAELTRQIESLRAWRESLTKGGLDISEALRNHETRLNKLEGKSKPPQKREVKNAKT